MANIKVKWMAVECISGQQPLNASSDVWSWGVTLWEVNVFRFFELVCLKLLGGEIKCFGVGLFIFQPS